jgi:hypothetical protein
MSASGRVCPEADSIRVELRANRSRFVEAWRFSSGCRPGSEAGPSQHSLHFVSLVILWPRTPNGAQELVVPAPKGT